MIKMVCDKCGREVYMKNPYLTRRAKIGFEEYDLCKHCILDIKRFINQGRADQKDEPQTERDCNNCGRDKAMCLYCEERNEWIPQTERSINEN